MKYIDICSVLLIRYVLVRCDDIFTIQIAMPFFQLHMQKCANNGDEGSESSLPKGHDD